MKKISKEDLSLDKQVVSALEGSNGTKDATDICTNPTVQTTLDSHGEICCYYSKDDKSCETCELSKCISCNDSDDETGCPISDDDDTTCMTPIPETQHC